MFLEAFLAYHHLLDINPPAQPNDELCIRIATGNQGLILRIKAGPTTTAFAGAGLSPENDVVYGILEITRHLPIPLKWEHVATDSRTLF